MSGWGWPVTSNSMMSFRRTTRATPTGSIAGFAATGRSRIGFSRAFPCREAGAGRTRSPCSTAGRFSTTCAAACCPPTSLGLLIASWLLAPRDRLDRHAGGRPATALPALGAAVHHGHHPAGVEGLLPRRKWPTICCGRPPMPPCFRTRPGWPWMPLPGSGTAASISHRGLLEWTGPGQPGRDRGQRSRFVLVHGTGEPLQRARGLGDLYRRPSQPGAGRPLARLVVSVPAARLAPEPAAAVRSRRRSLPEKDRRFLRQVARRTWRYFSDFVSDETSWLPPDNYQVSHQNHLAMRTSPTNIGLWMISALAAHDFGYLTVDQVVAEADPHHGDDRQAGAL